MDIVFIRELQIDTVIGVYDWERRVRQTLSLDLEMAFDNRPAAGSDDVRDALDYSAVAQQLIDLVSGSQYQLLESLAERCAELVMREFPVPWLRLKVSKPGAVKQARDVGVIIERGHKPHTA